MKHTISSKQMGIFTFDEAVKSYHLEIEGIRWNLDVSHEQAAVHILLEKAERLFLNIGSFDRQSKKAIAERLIDYKNDFWPEYDEDDEELDWDAVDAGDYNVKQEAFEAAITLCDIQISTDSIYCEYTDGDLFGGHRIHAYFEEDYKLISADV